MAAPALVVEVVAEELGPSPSLGDSDTEQGGQAGLRGT
jgi:hypothetical protein